MSWFNVWDGLKNKTCRYLLQRYLGQFLEEQLNLEQLKVELYNGKATVRNVSLKVEALNEIFEDQGWYVEVISGHIGVLTVTVPWNALMTNDSYIEASDILISLRPVNRSNEGTSMLESMWSSVSSSMQMAEECMKQKDEDTDGPFEMHSASIDGLEKFAETIDNVLNRIKAKFTNTTLRLECSTPDNCQGFSIDIKIDELNYKNETGQVQYFKSHQPENSTDCDTNVLNNEHKSDIFNENINYLPTFAKHSIDFIGMRLYTEEFKAHKLTRTYVDSDGNEFNKTKSHLNLRCEPDKIPILEVKGKQKIQVKLKQSEEINGPKVWLDGELGSFHVFLTPRQVHLLLKVLDAFYEDEKMLKNKCISDDRNEYKPKSAKCYSKNERSNMSGTLRNYDGWGEQSETATSEYILSEKTQTKIINQSDSLSSSISSNSTVTGTNKYQRKVVNMDSCAEILNFNVRIATLIAVILHEDILVESSLNDSEIPFNEKSHSDMLYAANNFFTSLPAEPCKESIKSSSLLCEKNHIFLHISPLFANGIQQRNKSVLLLKFSATATKLDFVEVLDAKVMPIILFDREENCADGFHKRPELAMVFNSEKQLTTLNVQMEKCTLELDISIYDRLSALLGPSPFANYFESNSEEANQKKPTLNINSIVEINVASSVLNVNLRFPITDARPIHHVDRIPWWKQNIRSDFVLLNFNHFSLNYKASSLDIFSNDINAYYCEKNANSCIHLLKTGLSTHEANNSVLQRPKITLFMANQHHLCSSKKKHFQESGNKDIKCKLPFSSKRVCRQSTPHSSKNDSSGSENILLPGEKEEINDFCDAAMKRSKLQIKIDFPVLDVVIESKLLYETLYNRFNTDLFMWQPSSPIFKTLAQQSCPQTQQHFFNFQQMGSLFEDSLTNQNYTEMANSDSNYNNKMSSNIFRDLLSSDCVRIKPISNDVFSSNSCDSIYLSAHEVKNQKQTSKAPNIESTNNCSIEVVVGKGNLLLFVPVRDMENLVQPEQHGKFYFKTDNLKIFVVSGFNSDDNVGYMCLQLSNIEMYHSGHETLNSPITLMDLDSNRKNSMHSTFYKVPEGLTKGEGKGCSKREMVSLVIEIKKLQEKKIKRLRIATFIQRITLRHNPALPPYTWFNQLMDFLEVSDYPIEGFHPFGVITEFQLHLLDCVADYRPRDLCYRALIEIGSLSINSNVISTESGCNLRTVMEDFVLSIAPYDNSSCEFFSTNTKYIESKNLVPVLEVGLLDISLRLGDKICDRAPIFDLRCSLTDVHLRTCSDSGCALAQLIFHFANDKDINSPTDDLVSCSSFEAADYSDSLSFAPSDEANQFDDKQKRVNLMIAEAVQDTIASSEKSTSECTESMSAKNSFQVYYFPDENTKNAQKLTMSQHDSEHTNELSDIINFESNVMMSSYYMKSGDPLPQVKADLGDTEGYNEKKTPDTIKEEDYCIIANDEKSFMNHCGIKSLKVCDEPLRIVDNHFYIPSKKPDLLRTPENFPTATQRYTLCDMTITWHLYGGQDFPDKETISEEPHKMDQPLMSEAYKHGVSFSKGAQGVNYVKKPKEKVTWKTKGGFQRNHEVLVEIQLSKVRFSHELYPAHESHASRQVLIVNDIEIRDRLQTSDINKFLYHPNFKKISNKSSQHMLVVKALHVRPDPKQNATQECSLRISLLPIRLHIDQDTLMFLTEYFVNIGDNCSSENVHTNIGPATSDQTTHSPIMTVDNVDTPAVDDLKARRLVAANINILMSDQKLKDADSSTEHNIQETAENKSLIYFREVIFSPDVEICFDYHGRRVELSRGPVAGLLMGLGQLQCSEIRLRKLEYRRGLLGWEKLLTYLCKEWLKDIKRNQLPKILSGVGPTYAFVQLFQGVYDLFWLPIEQYQKDGRVIKGLQLGAQSFTARTALAALEITSRIIQLLQFTAETAFDMVSPGPSIRSRKLNKGKKKRPYRPKDIREGVTNAYTILKEGINDSANALIETAVSEHDQKGYTGAVGAVMRQIPQLVVCPAVLATQATTNILGGVKSSLVPDSKIEAREKWKDDRDQ